MADPALLASKDRDLSAAIEQALGLFTDAVQGEEIDVSRGYLVLAQHRRHAIAVVAFGIFLAADAEEAAVEQAHRAGKCTLLR